MQNLNNAVKVDENSGLDSTPPNSDFEVNMIIKEIEGEILLQVRTKLLTCVGVFHGKCHMITCTHTHTQKETDKSQQKIQQAKRLDQLEKYLARPARHIGTNALSCGEKPSP